MNILFEITDKDIMFIGLFSVGIILFGVVIFYVLSKGEKEEYIIEDEPIKEEDSKELFEDIKPTTKEQQEAKDELERVFKQMSADLETKNAAPKAIEKFEQEQEENAIISYQELIKQAEEKRNNPLKDLDEIEEIEEEVAEPIEEVKPTLTEKKVKLSDEKVQDEKTFHNSEIISPIFGVQSPMEYKEAKAKKETEKINAYYDGNDNLDFLNSLKEFRNNL